MATTVYSTDDDLIKIRPNILELGVSDWEEQHQRAFGIVNRVILARWYKEAASEKGYDYRATQYSPDLVNAAELLDLSCYKTLELAYMYLMKDSPEPDGFEREMKLFRDLYNQELKDILAIGISYDWDGDDEIEDAERYVRMPRRLTRV